MSSICQHCGHENKAGALVCEQCLRSLIHHTPVAVVDTKWLANARASLRPETGNFDPPDSASDHYRIAFKVEGAQDLVTAEIGEQGIIIGRADLDTRVFPDVDLTPFNAEALGVSRRHAQLVINTATREIEISDLGSINGTYVNGVRLARSQSHYLNDGDEVRLGYLRIKFFTRSC